MAGTQSPTKTLLTTALVMAKFGDTDACVRHLAREFCGPAIIVLRDAIALGRMRLASPIDQGEYPLDDTISMLERAVAVAETTVPRSMEVRIAEVRDAQPTRSPQPPSP